MTLRDQWRAFVTDPDHAGRHLANLGKGVAPAEGPPVQPSRLTDFLARLPHGDSDITLIASIVDLASGGYDDFCLRQLPPLLDALANEKTDQIAVVGPMLRGNIRWDLTALGRLSGRLLSTQFLTRLPRRSFVLPENLLVRWLVEEMKERIAWIEGRIGTKALLPQFSAIRDGCEQALRHPWFREVPPPRAIEMHMRVAARRHRNPGYRRAAELAERRLSYLGQNRSARWQHILELLAVNWMAPLSDDDLFELYALVLVLDVLEKDFGLGAPIEYGLTVSGRSHVALFERNGSRVRVFFDQSPATVLGLPSYHVAILAAHFGVRGTPRRPDVVVVHDQLQARRVALVEVKRTADSAYLSDSVYKVLGYISDFRAIWEATPSNPKAILLFPEDVGPKPATKIADQEVVLVSSFDRQTVAAALGAGLCL